MRRYLFKSIVAGLLLCLGVSLHAQRVENHQWFSVGLSQNVKDFRWTYEQNLRMRYGMYILDNSFSEFGGRYKINKFVAVKAKYRIGFKEPHKGPVSFYHRVNLDLNFDYKWKAQDLKIEYRPRVQVRFKPDEGRTDQNWYVRNKVTLTRKINKKFDVWAAGELFHRLNKPGYPVFSDEWRALAGVDYEVKKRQRIRLFYLYSKEIQLEDPWTNHVVGLGYSYRFKKVKFNKDKSK